MPTNGYTSVAKIHSLLRIETADGLDDGVIDDFITQASRIIDGETRRTFYARTETHYYNKPHGASLMIYDDDLLTVTTLTNGNGVVITSGQYKLFPLNVNPKWEIKLLGSSGITWESSTADDDEAAITLVGTWGFSATAPADIEAACQDIVVGAYHKRFGENTTGIATVTAAGVVLTPKDIPDSAWKTIKRYERLV